MPPMSHCELALLVFRRHESRDNLSADADYDCKANCQPDRRLVVSSRTAGPGWFQVLRCLAQTGSRRAMLTGGEVAT